jgi:hypothetical protein
MASYPVTFIPDTPATFVPDAPASFVPDAAPQGPTFEQAIGPFVDPTIGKAVDALFPQRPQVPTMFPSEIAPTDEPFEGFALREMLSDASTPFKEIPSTTGKQLAAFTKPANELPMFSHRGTPVSGPTPKQLETLEKVLTPVSALLNQGIGIGNFMQSPLGAGTTFAGGMSALLRPLLGLGFMADIASNVPAAAEQAGTASVVGTPQEKADAYATLGTTVGLPAMIGAHMPKSSLGALTEAMPDVRYDTRGRPINVKQPGWGLLWQNIRNTVGAPQGLPRFVTGWNTPPPNWVQHAPPLSPSEQPPTQPFQPAVTAPIGGRLALPERTGARFLGGATGPQVEAETLSPKELVEFGRLQQANAQLAQRKGTTYDRPSETRMEGGLPRGEEPVAGLPQQGEGTGEAAAGGVFQAPQGTELTINPTVVGKEIGWAFSPTKQAGAIKLEGLTPEELATLAPSKAAAGWEFTDRRKGSPSEGFTFYTPENATREEILKAKQAKETEVLGVRKGEGTREVPNILPLEGDVTAKRISEVTKMPSTSKVSGEQMYARLRNVLGEKSTEWELVEPTVSALKASKDVVGLEDVAKLMNEGTKTEVQTFGMERKVSEARKEFDKLTHEWYDNLSNEGKEAVREYRENDFVDIDKDKAAKYRDLAVKIADEPRDTSKRARWSQYMSKDEAWLKEHNYVEGAISVPGKEIFSGQHEPFPANTVGHWRGFTVSGKELKEFNPGKFQGLPDDAKVFWMEEGQSDWGQTLHKQQKQIQERAQAGMKTAGERDISHPLLRDYNRLIVKSAMAKAREKGATHFVVSDAPTAMMMEGHDLQGGRWEAEFPSNERTRAYFKNWGGAQIDPFSINDAPQKIKLYDNRRDILEQAAAHLGVKVEPKFIIQQEPGMRLNYDRTYWTLKDKTGKFVKEAGPWATEREARANAKEGQTPVERPGALVAIAEELTGSKGEKVSLGEHKNVYETTRQEPTGQEDYPSVTVKETKKVLRKNLIFETSPGVKKVNVSGTMFPLKNVREELTLLGKKGEGVAAQNPFEPGAFPEVVDDLSKVRPGMRTLATATGIFNKETGKLQTPLQAVEHIAKGHKVAITAEQAEVARFLANTFAERLRLGKLVAGGEFAYANHTAAHLAVNAYEGPPRLFVDRVLEEVGHLATTRAIEKPLTPTEVAASKAFEKMRQQFLGTLSEAERGVVEKVKTVTREHLEGKLSEEQWHAASEDVGNELWNKLYHSQDAPEFVVGVFRNRELNEWARTSMFEGRNLLEVARDWVLRVLTGDMKRGTVYEYFKRNLERLGKEPVGPEFNVRGRGVKGEGTRRPTEEQKVFLTDPTQPLPDFNPIDVATKKAAEKFGMERIPYLGRAASGKGKIVGPRDESLARWHEEYYGMSRSIAGALGEEIRGKVGSAFKADKQGDLNVDPVNPNASKKISDVFEALQRNPQAYRLTPEQRTAYEQVLKPLLRRMSELTEKYGLADITDEHGNFKPYFPRIVTKHQRLAFAKQGKQVLGGKEFFQKGRSFETEKAGWDAKLRYETDVEARLIYGVERLYKAMANRRIADDPVFRGDARKQIVADLKEYYADELKSGAMKESQIVNMAHSLTGTVRSPLFFGKIYDSKTADVLNKALTHEASSVRRTLATVNSAAKGLMLGFDFGVDQIQLLPTAFAHPKVWAIANANAMRAMFDTQAFPAYVRKNLQYVRELAQLGSSVGELQEMMAGLKPKAPLTKIPLGVGTLGKAFARQFQTAIDVAKIELWKAYREVTPKAEWSKTVQTLEAMLGTARMESTMVPHTQALLERALLLAPSYYRSAGNFMATLADKGVSRRIAWRTAGSFALGSVAMFWGIGKALGMDDDELVSRLDPSKPEFMQWQTETQGRLINFGPGGIFRSFLRTLGKSVRTTIENPKNLASLESGKNPAVGWLRGHAGPLPSWIWDLVSGKDYMGREVSIGDLPHKIVPLAGQDYLQALLGKGEMPTHLETGAQMLGAASYPARLGEQTKLQREKAAGEKFGRRYEELNVPERAQITQTVKEKAFKPKMSAERVAALGAKRQEERRDELTRAMPREVRSWLKERGVRLSGYEQTLPHRGTDIPLLDEEGSDFTKLVIEEYKKTFLGGDGLSGILNETHLASMPKERLEEVLSKRLTQAKLRARARLRRQISEQYKPGVR